MTADVIMIAARSRVAGRAAASFPNAAASRVDLPGRANYKSPDSGEIRALQGFARALRRF
jgi:hypothetical protein